MISLGSRDARKGLGLGLGLGLGFGAGAEMEETDLEEGEACFYQNDDYSTIDPDIALSYIDEKIQDVLGHFQKDFEGGVSAENLGAKFGGYGSFLPTYQRSPVWSHPRTPQKVNKSSMPRSPNKIHMGGGHHNSKVLSNASLSVRHGQASAPASSLPSVRTSVNDSANGDVGVSFPPCAEESTSGSEPGEKYAHPFEQKTLKVRIKVGSDNLSNQRNADIYSGLGLDNSPASSFDDIRTNSERFSREHQDGPDESPTSILQIMTSFPVHGNRLLSPLPDDLFHFTEKEKQRGESKPRFLQKGGQESSNGSDAARVDDKVVEVKKRKPLEKHADSIELNNFNDKETQNGTSILSKKEKDIEALDCEELVASALKLPLLSNSYSKVVNSANGTASVVGNSTVANKGKEEFFSDVVKHETVAVSTPEIGLAEKHSGKAASAGKFWEDKKLNSSGDNPKKDINVRVEKADVSTKVDSNVSKARKNQNADPVDFLEKASKKTISLEEDGMQLASGKEQSSSGDRKKSKGSQSHSAQGAEVPKDGSRIDSSFVPKNRKSTHENYYLYKSEMEDSKLERDNEKARNTYKDFFGDIELEPEDNDADSAEMLSIGRSKDFEAVEKSTIVSNTPSKETLNGKKTEKPFTSEPHSKASLNAGPPAWNGSITDAAPGTVGPVVKEDWVCCDKCQKWRLLPLGTNPDSLPEKWLCSMLNWLPGMNRCSVSEEETTKALITPYQVPAPENQNNQHVYPGGVLPGVSLADGSHFDQNHQNLGFHPVPSGGKKKNGTKDVPAVLGQVGPAKFSNSTKKNLQATVKSRSLNGVNQSRPASEIAPIHLSKSSGVEKHRHKQKEKNKLLEQHSDGGEIRSSKIKSKRDNDQDHFRVSKKIKIDGMHCTGEDWMSDRDGLVGKVGPSSSSGLSGRASGKDQHKYDDPSSKDGKCEVNSSSKGPHRNPKDQGQVTSGDGCPNVEKIDDKAVRKRKMNGSQDTHVYTASLLSGHHPYDQGDFTEQRTEDIHRKKARVSKSEGKEAIASKGSGGAAGISIKEQQLGPDLGSSQSHRSLDATDSLRRDVQSVRRSQAATSSSSKVSGSHKSKINKQEAKGSPVESVSSSPLRFSYPDKSTSTRKSHEGKDYFGDAGFYAAGTPRRCSDGEDDRGSYRSGTFQERDIGHLADSEANIQNLHSPELANGHFANGGTDAVGNGSQCPSQPQALDQRHDGERKSDKQCHANVSRPRKPGKGSSSRSKDKNGSSKSELDKGKAKISDSCNEFIDRAPYEESSRAEKHGVREKLVVNSDEVEKNFGGKKEPSGKVANANSKRESRSDALSSQDQNQDMRLDSGERSSTRYLSERADRAEVCGRGKSHPLPQSGRGQNERVAHSPHLNQGSQKENGESSSLIVECGDELKAPKQTYQSETQNRNQLIRSRHPTINSQRVRDVDAPSPVRRDSSNQATNAVKEAKDLKHLADRLKNSGSTAESTGLYFQAALKFLHGASLLQSTNGESAKQGEMIQSMQIYSSTAKLCEFCAHEYEKSKDMAAAALAYKCMEVAYMRVIYSSHTSASRDRHELQSALLIVPPGESPSSSASDVDNVNNPPPFEKAPLAKGVSSPQVAGNQFIAAKNRPSFVRLLNFAQDVNYAMEASRKSRMAFTAANQRKEAAQYREGMTSVKTALDFNFQDVEGLLHLVRLAMEAIGR